MDYTKLYQDVQNNKDLSTEEKVNRIKNITASRNKEINWQHAKKLGQYYGGAGLEVASMFIPGMTGAKVAKAGLKLSKPLINQIVKKELTKGVVEGAASGGAYGFGRGMLEDKNPLTTAVHDASEGALTGLGLGAVAGGLHALNPRVRELDKTLDKRKDWGIAYRKQSGNPEGAINKLLEEQQGFVPDAFHREGIGDVDLVWGKQNPVTGEGFGLKHIIDGRIRKNKIDGVDFVKNLPETIENGVVTRENVHPNNLNIEDLNAKIAIPNNWNGKSRNWVLTAHPQNKSASKRLAAYIPQLSKPHSGSRSSFTAELTADNNIIPNNPPKLKSWNEWLEELRRTRGH